MSVIGKAARAVDAFRARREGRTIGEGALASALSLFRTVRLMRDQGEVTTAWALWASLWCYFVGALVAADALRGLESWAVVALFRATYDRAQALPSRAAALVAADVLRLHAGALSGLLPVEYRGAAGRVVDAWAGLVRAGLEAAPCAWCVGDPPPPGPAGGFGWAPVEAPPSPGSAGAAGGWFRYAPATAPKPDAPPGDPCAPRPVRAEEEIVAAGASKG